VPSTSVEISGAETTAGIHPRPLQEEREYGRHRGGPTYDDDRGERYNQRDVVIDRHREGPHEHRGRHHHADAQPHHDLSPPDAKDVVEMHISHRHGSHDGRDDLRANIPPRANEQRDEEAQRHNFVEGIAEDLQYRGGIGSGDKQHHEPYHPLAKQQSERRPQIRLVQWLGTAEALDVLGGLLLHHVGQIVGGQYTEQSPIFGHHWQSQEVVVHEDPDRLLLIPPRPARE